MNTIDSINRAKQAAAIIAAGTRPEAHLWTHDDTRQDDKLAYCTEVSDLQGHYGETFLDPWGQPLTMSNFSARRNRDNEITHWESDPWTTPGGVPVTLTIFND